ncbi:MAG: MFS transporter [Thermoplasmata archaeon]
MRKSFLILHLALFSFGYGMAVFALPPFVTVLGAGQFYLGEFGFFLMLPNVVLPYFFSKLKNLDTVSKFVIFGTLTTGSTIFLLIIEKSLNLVLVITLVLGIGQFIWWITTEIFFTGISRGTNLINIYSVVWGTSYFIAPLLAGYMIQRVGYAPVFSVSFAMVMIAIIMFIIAINQEKFRRIDTFESSKGTRILIESFIPSFGAGIVFGTLTSIFPGFLLHNGITVLELGILSSALAMTRLVGFIYLTRISDVKKLRNMLNLSFLLLIPIILPFLVINFYVLLAMMLIIGFSTAFGISAPLIYISNIKEANVSKNIALYELSFGSSVSIFALIGGYISQQIGNRWPYFIDFVIIAVMAIYFIRAGRRR